MFIFILFDTYNLKIILPTLECSVHLLLTTDVQSISTGALKLGSDPPGNLLIPRTKTKLGKRAFGVFGPRAWNALPTEVRTLKCPALANACQFNHIIMIIII